MAFSSKFKLTLMHKLGLLVSIPLVVNFILYMDMQKRINSLELLIDQLAERRDMMVRANNIITNQYFAIQSLMQFKMFGIQKVRQNCLRFIKAMDANVQPLSEMLTRSLGNPQLAKRLLAYHEQWQIALKESQFAMDEQNQIASFFDDLERNQRLKRTMIGYLNTLYDVSSEARTAVEKSTAEEGRSKEQLQNLYRLGLIINSLSVLALALIIGYFMVRKVQILGENFERFANDKPLLPPLRAQDELTELDRRFRQMANSIENFKSMQSEMLQTIASSRDELQTVIDTLPSALFITDESGKVESINKFAEQLLGINLEYFDEAGLVKAFKIKKEMKANFVQMLLRDAAENPVEMEALTSDREIVPVRVSITPFHFESSGQKKYLTAVVDETEAFKLRQAKSDFFSMISHDMRTPLTTINGVLQMALVDAFGEIPEMAKSKFRLSLSSSSLLLDLINRLLRVEKLGGGNIELYLESADIADIVHEVEKVVLPQLEARQLKLTVDTQSCVTKMDKSYVLEVIMNLVTNAMKYSPDGGQIRVRSTVEDGKEILIEVEDEGPGVPSSKRQVIFERFKQADKDRDRKIGFGLGLAICKSIVAQHGGTIGVTDAKSGGSCFWVRLPILT